MYLLCRSLGLLTIGAAVVVEAANTLPVCAHKAAATQTALPSVRTVMASMPKSPVAIVYATEQKNTAFVVLDGGSSHSSLGVLDTSSFKAVLQHQVSLPSAYLQNEGPQSASLTNDGQYILIAAGPGAIVVNAARAAAGQANAVAGTLNGTTAKMHPGTTAKKAISSKDDKYVFISQPGPSNIDVIQMNVASDGSITGTPVAASHLNAGMTDLVLGPEGTNVYATTLQGADGRTEGYVAEINAAGLEQGYLVFGADNAGCGTSAVIISADHQVAWATSRDSNYLVALNATYLRTDQAKDFIASLEVGTSPLALTFARGGQRVLTADSNLYNYPNATSGISVVNASFALTALDNQALGRIATGKEPRDLATSPDDTTVLVANYGSNEIQAIDVSTLP